MVVTRLGFAEFGLQQKAAVRDNLGVFLEATGYWYPAFTRRTGGDDYLFEGVLF